MIRLKIFVGLLLITGVVHAEICNTNNQVLGANYQVVSQNKQKDSIAAQDITLWRDHKRVAHVHSGNQVTEIWEKTSNGQLKLTRHFDAYKRGIEYDPYDINSGKGETEWGSKYQLISQKLKNKMTLKKSKGKGCDRLEKYKLTQGDTKFVLEWLPHQQLVKRYDETSPRTKVKWRLKETIVDPTRVKQAFAMRSNYQTTDYTDIGDNESDPFLLNMMNLGFIEHGSSGFYNTEGQDIGEHHHH